MLSCYDDNIRIVRPVRQGDCRATSNPSIPRIRQSSWAGAFLDGVNAASLALMGVVTAVLARSALVDRLTLGVFAASAVCLLGTRINSSWLVLAGALVGLAANR